MCAIDEYNLTTEVRHLMIRDMENTGQMMVVLVTWHESVNELDKIIPEIIKILVIKEVNSK